jgi:hypothetical protein
MAISDERHGMRRPVEVVLACLLTVGYVVLLLGIAASLVWKVVLGTDNLMSDDGVGFSLLVLWVGCLLLLVGAAALYRGMGRGPLLIPLLTVLAVGTVGEVIDLVGNATVKGNMIGAAILAAALFPVLLASTPLARRWAGLNGTAQTPPHLLPHERWFVDKALKAQRKKPTRMFTNAQVNYGPDGATRLLATYASVVPGQTLGVLGIGTLLASGGRDYLVATSSVLILLAMFVMTPGVVRMYQGVRLGRTFRGDRPFQR